MTLNSLESDSQIYCSSSLFLEVTITRSATGIGQEVTVCYHHFQDLS